MAGLIGSTIADLKAKPLINSAQLNRLRNFIATQRPGISGNEAAMALADAISNLIDRQLVQLREDYRQLIKRRLLELAFRKTYFEITGADVLKSCLQQLPLDYYLLTEISDWINQWVRRRISVEKLAGFALEYRRLAAELPKLDLLELTTIIENQAESDNIATNRILKFNRWPARSGAKSALNSKLRTRPQQLVKRTLDKVPILEAMPEVIDSNLGKGQRGEAVGRRIVNIAAAAVIIMGMLVTVGFYRNNSKAVTATAAIESEVEIVNPTTASVTSPEAETVKATNITDQTIMTMRATAYDLSIISCGKTSDHPQYGLTYSGTKAKVGRTIAADPAVLPLGKRVYIIFPERYQNWNGVYVVEDTGRLIKGNKIDIFFGEDLPEEKQVFEEALRFGVQMVQVRQLPD